MRSHLSTPETFMLDAPEVDGTCPVCLSETTIRVGWIDHQCNVCANYFSIDTPFRTVRLRRERLGLTVKDMAERVGVSPSTVKQYERRWPSRRYWEVTKEFVALLNGVSQ